MADRLLGRIHVTRHALERWRQRGARFGDETAEEVRAALRQARRLAPGEPSPQLRPRPGDVCYLHEALGLYFVVVPSWEGDGCRVITLYGRHYGPGG